MKTIAAVTGGCVLYVVACAATLDDPERFTVASGAAPSPAVDGAVTADVAAACPNVPQTVFVAKCGTAGCHDAPHTSSDNLDLVAPNVASRLVGISASEGGLLVDPKSPKQSVLYRRLQPGGVGVTMPPTGPLDAATVVCVLSWIQGVASSVSLDSGSSGPPDATQAAETSTWRPIRVAAGSAVSYADHDGNTWTADVNFTGGDIDSRTNPISGTTDVALYQSERWGTTFSYAFMVLNADYNVMLKFAETYSGAQTNGGRVFNLSINGQPALRNFDIFANAGPNAAFDKTFPVTVTDGMIVLKFDGVAGAAKVDAIAVTAK
jgi:hypothetical protein